MTVIQTRKNRQTGTTILVNDRGRDDAEVQDGDARWETICDEHGTVCSHDTRKLAEWHAAEPLGWCEECMKVAEREARRQGVEDATAGRPYRVRNFDWQPANDVYKAAYDEMMAEFRAERAHESRVS